MGTVKTITKEFQIETSPDVMQRIERFLALLHHNSNFGHSGLFAMPLDGDGCDKVKVTPRPKFSEEVDLLAGVGGDVEIAYDDSYGCKSLTESKTSWVVKPTGSLYKDGHLHKTYPSDLR